MLKYDWINRWIIQKKKKKFQTQFPKSITKIRITSNWYSLSSIQRIIRRVLEIRFNKGENGNYRIDGISDLRFSVPRVWSVTLAHRQNQFLVGASINHFTWYGPRGAIYRACRFASYAKQKCRWSSFHLVA